MYIDICIKLLFNKYFSYRALKPVLSVYTHSKTYIHQHALINITSEATKLHSYPCIYTYVAYGDMYVYTRAYI